MAVSSVTASIPGKGVMYSAMMTTVYGNDPAGQVAKGDVCETGIHHQVGEFILRRVFAYAFRQVAITVFVIGDQFAQPGQNTE